ncbi:MAG: DUF971 domain-containing protein [Ignavibacteriae bacterium]|nr:DUF971 domain-containing protein [Ignavibacteriota bacterium]MCB9207749.1 DUF971 domain-containing protein [Ignavibacteriales bacterium]MCB9258519.1 DUF971 domain-containing protein [Ignavibacteriales bacterium]
MARPKKIKLNKQESLIIEWDNGKTINYPLTFLRDESPDAGNKGETILWKHYAPPPKGPDKPGKYEVADIQKVGNYAITIKWKDGEDAGIYSWEVLERFGEFLEMKNTFSSNN